MKENKVNFIKVFKEKEEEEKLLWQVYKGFLNEINENKWGVKQENAKK